MIADRTPDRLLIARHPTLRGIDGARVLFESGGPVVELHFVRAAPGVMKTPALTNDEFAGGAIRLEGEGARGWRVVRMEPARDEPHVVRVVLERAEGAPPASPAPAVVRIIDADDIAPGFDAVRVRLTGAGRVEDVEPQAPQPPRERASAEIDYVTKDYAGFQRFMLDRMAAVLPAWTERHAADEGNAIVELLAYAADYLSYYQDAVATEAYLTTARRRTSVRRHARLLMYRMDEGCTPRVWLHFAVDPGLAKLTVRRGFSVGTPGSDVISQNAFVVMRDTNVFAANNAFAIYDYGTDEYTLARGATSAAFRVPHGPEPPPAIADGDVIVFEQTVSPLTGRPADADPGLRQAVRVRGTPRFVIDPLRNVEFCEVGWDDADALGFDLPVARRVGSRGERIAGLAHAIGNIVPADYGTDTVEVLPPATGAPDYRPQLTQRDLTFYVPFDDEEAREPASAFTELKPYKAVPDIQLVQHFPELRYAERFPDRAEPMRLWQAARDLLAGDRDARIFTVEMETDRTPTLRFGDDVHGRSPESGSTLRAYYRVGNGPTGHLGPDVLTAPLGRAFTTATSEAEDEEIKTGCTVRNPLPPGGGADPEPIDRVRRNAPDKIRTRRSAVVPADFVEAATALPKVRAAAAATAFTGTWVTVRLYVQRVADGEGETPAFLRSVRAALEPFRTIDAEFVTLPPAYVTIEAEAEVTSAPGVEPEALRARVDTAFAALLASEAFTFGQAVYPSPFVSAAMRVGGVRDARVTRLARVGAPRSTGVDAAPVALAPHEIASIPHVRVRFVSAGAPG